MTNHNNADSAIVKAVQLLNETGALRLGESPWGTYSDDEDVSSVDFDDLMNDGGHERKKSMDLPPDIAAEIGDALNRPVPDRSGMDSSAGRQPSPSPVSWDVCAWYQPIHFHALDWGIFVREECLIKLAARIALDTNPGEFQAEKTSALRKHQTQGVLLGCWRLSDPELFLRAAFIMLFLHEHFHHRIECLGLRLHVVTGTPLYVPYFKNIYGAAKGTDDLLEEALANACMFLRISEETYKKLLPATVRKAMRSMLTKTFPHEAPGYRMAINYLDQSSFNAGENRLHGYMRETTLSPVQPSRHWDSAPRLTQSFFNIKSHIYSVVPISVHRILPISIFPHTCSTNEMTRICTQFGYTENPAAGKGSHIKLEKADAAPVILPYRKNLSKGVIKNALAAIGPYKLGDLPRLKQTRQSS